MTSAKEPARLIRLEAEEPHSYPIEVEIYTIGRSPLCQLQIAHPIVSRLHAKVERKGAHYLISDIGSANGTYLNGQRLSAPRLLMDGDLIGLGSAAPILRFEA